MKRFKKVIGRAALVAAATASFALPGASSAQAAITGTDVSIAPCGGFWNGAQQQCQAVGQRLVSVGTGAAPIAVSCTVETPGASTSQSTGVRCYLLGDKGDIHWVAPASWTTGPSSTTSGEVTSGLISESYQVCIYGGWTNNGYSTGLVNPTCVDPI